LLPEAGAQYGARLPYVHRDRSRDIVSLWNWTAGLTIELNRLLARKSPGRDAL